MSLISYEIYIDIHVLSKGVCPHCDGMCCDGTGEVEEIDLTGFGKAGDIIVQGYDESQPFSERMVIAKVLDALNYDPEWNTLKGRLRGETLSLDGILEYGLADEDTPFTAVGFKAFDLGTHTWSFNPVEVAA